MLLGVSGLLLLSLLLSLTRIPCPMGMHPFLLGALHCLLLCGNNSIYYKMLIFMTFRRSLRSLHYALLLAFMPYITLLLSICIYIPLCQCTLVPPLILYCIKLYTGIVLWSMIVGLHSGSPLKTNKTHQPMTTYSFTLLHSPYFLVCVDAWTHIHRKQT